MVPKDLSAERALDVLEGDVSGAVVPIDDQPDLIVAPRQHPPEHGQPALDVAERREVHVGDQQHQVGLVQRRHGGGRERLGRVHDDVVVVLTQEVQDAPDLVRARRLRPLGMERRREEVHPRLVLLDVRGEQVGVHPVEVLHHVHEVEPRLDPEVEGDFAQLEIEVHQQRALRGEAVEHDRQVGGDAGDARAALGAEQGVEQALALGLGRAGAHGAREPRHRVAQRAVGDRLDEVVRHPRPHGREEQLLGELRAGGENPVAGVRVGEELGELHAQLRIALEVEDQDLGIELPEPPDLLLSEGGEAFLDLESHDHAHRRIDADVPDLLAEPGVGRDERGAESGRGHNWVIFGIAPPTRPGGCA